MTDRPEPTMLEQMGGVRGAVYSAVPVAAFIPANILWPLNIALMVALGAAAAILLWRLVRRENLTPAISGFLGVGVCAVIARWTGEGRGFYLYGIVSLWVWGLVFVVSLFLRRPLVGVAWAYLKGIETDWRSDPVVRRYYEIATLFWGASFLTRAILQTYLYSTDQETLLGVVKIVLGWPVAAVGAIITVWAVRKAGHEHSTAEGAARDAESEETPSGPASTER